MTGDVVAGASLAWALAQIVLDELQGLAPQALRHGGAPGLDGRDLQ